MIKLEIAKQHQEMICELCDKLNAAVAHATMEGLHIEVEVNEVSTIGARNHPIVLPNVKVKPCDIDTSEVN
ncbi:hypothetical protein OMDBNIEC_00024 [Salmonella phage STP-SP5]|nr:hypothetical protein OMDBNIEC_00024 [Salmonella phage STP-SP5]